PRPGPQTARSTFASSRRHWNARGGPLQRLHPGTGMPHARPFRSPDSSRNERAWTLEISARNQLKGRIVALRRDTVMTEVEVGAGGGNSIAAAITGSVETLGLKEGDGVLAVIKATEAQITRRAARRPSTGPPEMGNTRAR